MGSASAGGRLLFAATSKGSLRAYRLPLGPEFQEVHCSVSPMTQLALSQDCATLFAANTEGLLFVFAVKDRDPSRYPPSPSSPPLYQAIILTVDLTGIPKQVQAYH